MNTKSTASKIESAFRKQAQNDKNVRNAYLLVNSDQLGIDLRIAEGKTGDQPANILQPNHLASVGKLFTATLIGMLYEKNLLDYSDSIAKYLDSDLMNGLHVYKGTDYSGRITIRHLLTQTSGLNDVFYELYKKMISNPGFRSTPREAVIWGKENLQPVAPPGKKHFYADPNYYLAGLIVEKVCGKPFHEAMHEMVFEPIGMEHACMYGYSKPATENSQPPAALYIKDVNLFSVEGIHELDYAGGCVMAPLEDFLKFMKSLTGGKLIKKETLQLMIEDDYPMGFPVVGFDYGYSIWKLKSLPLIIPKKYFSWGCVGVTGAFMFFHPATRSYIIGSFNDFSYRGKALQFMMRKVIKELLKSLNS
ncbi:MAG: serine hydrolase domain-containing protein [Candidatus Kapaibacterium sp.]